MIKVLKPGIEDTLVADLNFIYVVARILEFLNPELQRTSLVNALPMTVSRCVNFSLNHRLFLQIPIYLIKAKQNHYQH